MRPAHLTVDNSLRLASRHPGPCARMLADNLYPILDETEWFTQEWRLRFCAYFLQNLADNSIENDVDEQLLDRLRRLPLCQGLKLLEGSSHESGLKVLVALVCRELRNEQHLDMEQQYLFYNTLFGKFFPGCALR